MGKKKKRALAHDDKREASKEASAGAQAMAQPGTASTAAGAHEQAAASQPKPTPAIAGRRRTPENAFIALFLAFMLGMPLRYYMGGRGFDERFSWRMFSTIRMLECKATVVEDVADGSERRVDLGQEVQVAWVGLLERGRELVIDKL